MRIIAGAFWLQRPDPQRLWLRRRDPWSAGTALRRYLPEGAPSYPEMTPRSFLEFVADIRGLTGKERRTRLDEVHAQLHLDKVSEQPIETLLQGL